MGNCFTMRNYFTIYEACSSNIKFKFDTKYQRFVKNKAKIDSKVEFSWVTY